MRLPQILFVGFILLCPALVEGQPSFRAASASPGAVSRAPSEIFLVRDGRGALVFCTIIDDQIYAGRYARGRQLFTPFRAAKERGAQRRPTAKLTRHCRAGFRGRRPSKIPGGSWEKIPRGTPTPTPNPTATATPHPTATPPPPGTVRYVRPGAGGDGSGEDWANALPALPETLQRGFTYYIADGSYGSYTFDDPVDGEKQITLRKATVSDHGTETGWSPEYGDGQAIFEDALMISDRWLIDGQRRNESDWTDGGAYGFRFDAFYSNSINFGHCSDFVTVRYAEVGGVLRQNYSADNPSAAFYFGGFGEVCEHWTLSRLFVHNVGIVGQMAGVDSVIWEHSWLGLSWSKEIIRGQVRASNVTIRYNIMKDGCRDEHAPGTGCTAEVAFFGNQGSSNENYSNAAFYGNVIWKTIAQHNSDACLLVQNAHNGIAFNNTLVNNSSSGMCLVSFNGTNSSVRNNIWYLPNGMNGGCVAAHCSGNVIYSATPPPFVNLAQGDFRLSQAVPGVALPDAYQTDLRGVLRGGDGIWDAGAYEFEGP